MMKLLAVLVFLGCVSESWQFCFSQHCPHHTNLAGCVQGSYTCKSGEFCEAVTHLEHGNAPWVLMHCRSIHHIDNCWALQASNDPNCDPTKHSIVCHWCCETEQCMRDLTNGVIPQPPGATTSAPAVTMTTGMSATSQAAPVNTTSDDGSCVDLYLGDCSVDFAGRCAEDIVLQLCQRTCNVC